MANMPQNGWVGAGQMFQEVASQIANELVQRLTEEHTREIMAMHQENLVLRNELSRVVDLMNGYLEREQYLHNMLEQLNKTYEDHTRHLHETHSQLSARAQQTVQSNEVHRKGLAEPMMETIMEVARIKEILSQPTIQPAGPFLQTPSRNRQSLQYGANQGMGQEVSGQLEGDRVLSREEFENLSAAGSRLAATSPSAVPSGARPWPQPSPIPHGNLAPGMVLFRPGSPVRSANTGGLTPPGPLRPNIAQVQAAQLPGVIVQPPTAGILLANQPQASLVRYA